MPWTTGPTDSRWEGFGHVIVEAMETNTPIISTNCRSGPSEIIKHNFDGILRAGFNISNVGPKMKYSKVSGGTESYIPTNLRLGSGFEFIFDSNNSLALTLEVNKLLVPSPSEEVLNSNGELVAYRQPDIGFLQGIFKSFGDAPDGIAEEIKELTYALGLEYSFNN